MKKIFPFLVALIAFYACQNPKENTETNPTVENSAKITEADTVQKWLSSSIENFFNQNKTDILEICTPQYDEYKSDAINVDFDGGMTVEAFKAKWKGKYNIDKDEIGTAFIISGQDNGKIKVKDCKLISSENGVYYLEITIDDLDFKESYKRKIKVVKVNDKFLIDDVENLN